jgi:ASC-1-like (ASCH) protein
MKGIIYIMTTAVSGLIKIGKTGTDNFSERMRFLEANGYYNVAGLKRFFAIELEDYDDKENLLHDIFNKHQVGESELFALDQELLQQLLLSFKGRVIYPEHIDQEKEFDVVAQNRKESRLFSFYKKGLKNGDEIVFKHDTAVVAKVAGEREVEYGGQMWKLSPLVYKIYEQRGELSKSGAYAGADHFFYHGKKLRDLPDIA